MPNAWVNHVKQFAAANKTTYGCALSMSECKNSYKSKKEPKTKESKEIKETKAYTKYDKPIGPVKPAAPAPKKNLDKSTIKKMLEMSMKEMSDYKEPKIRIPKK
jgi:hypothetical protein